MAASPVVTLVRQPYEKVAGQFTAGWQVGCWRSGDEAAWIASAASAAAALCAVFCAVLCSVQLATGGVEG
jgi:hypothetical protein